MNAYVQFAVAMADIDDNARFAADLAREATPEDAVHIAEHAARIVLGNPDATADTYLHVQAAWTEHMGAEPMPAWMAVGPALPAHYAPAPTWRVYGAIGAALGVCALALWLRVPV